MKTFKIRDLMVALRPGIGTPQRPKPFDCCLPSCPVSDDTIEMFDSDGCDDSGVGCGDTGCGDTGCGDTGCGDTACPNSLVQGCGGGWGCSLWCSNADSCALTCGNGFSECPLATCFQTCRFASCRFESCILGGGTHPFLLAEPDGGCGRSCEQQSCGASEPLVEQMSEGQLARLKNQLRRTMQQVNKRERALADAAEKKALEPKSIEQVDSLEKLLSEALQALRARRAELQKTEPKRGRPAKKGK